MQKIIHIIPGLGENCEEARYKKLIKALESKGYKVCSIKPDWYKPISGQIFPVSKNDIIFGFSLGAVLAYLVAKKYPCKKLILASISPIHIFTKEEFVKHLTSYMGSKKAEIIFKDLTHISVDLTSIKTPFVSFKGELEDGVEGQIEIPGTKHRLTSLYIKTILKHL